MDRQIIQLPNMIKEVLTLNSMHNQQQIVSKNWKLQIQKRIT